MKYVIHLGVHKTASSLLRQNLSHNLDHLRAQRVFYVNAEMPTPLQRQLKMLRRLRIPDSPSPAMEDFAQLNAAITDHAARAGADTVLISDENRLGPSMGQQLAWNDPNPGFYANAISNLTHAFAGLPLERTTLLIYTRNPDSYLLSVYSDAIREAQTNLTLEGFCRTVNFNAIDFDGLERRLASLHPGITVKSRQYERIKLGPDPYMRTFLRDIGLDPKPFELHATPLTPQLDAIQVEALLHIMAGSGSKRWRFIKKLRNQVLAGAPNPLAPLVLPDWVSDSLRVTAEGRASDSSSHVA